MRFDYCAILLSFNLLFIAYFLISRCVKYAHSLPDEDVNQIYAEYWRSRNIWPQSLME